MVAHPILVNRPIVVTPKGVMLSHKSLISSFLCSTATMPMREDAIFLHSPPMFHLADAAMVIGVTMVGGNSTVKAAAALVTLPAALLMATE